jgi:SAM-dependent methyltransferase
MHSQPKNMRPGPVSRPGIFLRNAEVFVRYISFKRHFLAALFWPGCAKFLTVLEAVSDCLCHAVDTNRNAINPVTAVDRTTHLLNKARTKAKAAHVKIEWVQKDMRDFVRPDCFALVLSLFTSFGYFDDRQEDMIVLKNIFSSLRPGGVCLIEVLGKRTSCKTFSVHNIHSSFRRYHGRATTRDF